MSGSGPGCVKTHGGKIKPSLECAGLYFNEETPLTFTLSCAFSGFSIGRFSFHTAWVDSGHLLESSEFINMRRISALKESALGQQRSVIECSTSSFEFRLFVYWPHTRRLCNATIDYRLITTIEPMTPSRPSFLPARKFHYVIERCQP